MEEIDLYEVLEIQKGASTTEIRKAYHKLAKTHHPDKAAPEDREEAEIRFKAIGQAYEILYDEEKRAAYDQHGMAAFDSSRGGRGGGPDLDDLMAEMFGGAFGGMGGMPPGMGGGGMPGMGGARKPRKGEDEEKEFPVTLEELYSSKTQKFGATKSVVCGLCKGKGAKESAKGKKCSSCQGQGAKQAHRQMGPFLTPVIVPCEVCNGTGDIYSEKEKCKKCKGKRTVSEKKVLELYIPRGSHDGDRIVLQGEADQNPEQEPGDLVFVLDEQEHKTFERGGADLLADIHITLAEALCGLSRVVVKHLDGRGIAINHQKPKGGILRPGQILKVDGEGMPIKKSEMRGDLFLRINVDFPEDDYLQDETLTAKLVELLPKPGPTMKTDTVDEVEYDQDASMEDFGGGTDAQGGEAWEDEDEDEGQGGAQCAQQ